jgi:hypothetical protein
MLAFNEVVWRKRSAAARCNCQAGMTWSICRRTLAEETEVRV